LESPGGYQEPYTIRFTPRHLGNGGRDAPCKRKSPGRGAEGFNFLEGAIGAWGLGVTPSVFAIPIQRTPLALFRAGSAFRQQQLWQLGDAGRGFLSFACGVDYCTGWSASSNSGGAEQSCTLAGNATEAPTPAEEFAADVPSWSGTSWSRSRLHSPQRCRWRAKEPPDQW
jgi:hypothetical protein